jgi:cell shape-determining protein MreD
MTGRHFALIGVAYVMLIAIGPLWRITPFDVVAPNLAVIFAAYLGVTVRQNVLGPTAAAIGIGYLADLLGGTPPGLMAFCAGLLCLLSRVATRGLLVRGRGFVMVMAGAATLVAAILVLGLRAYHGARIGDFSDEILVALGSALVTGALAVPVFRVLRTVDARFARTEREREAVREGYLN